jgi:predicted permease
MNFSSVLFKMIELFIVIIIGYIGCKCKVLDKEARYKLSRIVLYITLPATILSSVLNQNELPQARQIVSLLVVAALSYVILFAAAFIFPKLLRIPKDKEGVYRFMFTFGNVGFIGFPVTEAIFGSSSIFYTAVFNLPFNLLVFSVGVTFLSKQKQKISIGTFITPSMIASILAIILAFLDYKGPAIAGSLTEMIGSITTPAALMIIGSSLADMPVKDMFNNVRVYIFSLLRLIVVPLITYVVFGLFIKDTLLLGVTVIIAAMPVATNGTMLCLQYGGDEKLMAQGTFITTVLSIVTIPVLAMLFI